MEKFVLSLIFIIILGSCNKEKLESDPTQNNVPEIAKWIGI